jgi:DNA-binding NarL/FixJ family response regulator
VKKTQKILLVDDHPLFRQALRAVVNRAQPQLYICEAETLAGARAILARESNFEIVMLDLKLPDCCGFTGLMSLQSEYPQIPFTVVSSSADATTISRAMAFGAAGFIPKSTKRADIAYALETILSGEIWTPSSVLSDPVPKLIELIASLTPAQLRVLMGVQCGLRNKQIAFEMGVTEKTVKAYMTALFRKLGVNSRTQALIAAQTLLLETEPVP